MLLAAVQDVTVIVLLISGVVSTVLGLALERQGGDSWIEVIVDGWSDVLSALPRVLFCHKSADIPRMHAAHACAACHAGGSHHGSSCSGGPGNSSQQLSEGAAVSCPEPNQ